jgi:predicted transposase YdaD
VIKMSEKNKGELFTEKNKSCYHDNTNLLTLLGKFKKVGIDVVQVLEKIQYTNDQQSNKQIIAELKTILPKKYHQLPDDVLLAMCKSVVKYADVYQSLANK